MANKHILSLEVPTVANCEIFRVKDTSQYTDSLYVDCGELLITPPGFNQGNLIKVQPGFDLAINSCSLGIQTAGCTGTSQSGQLTSTVDACGNTVTTVAANALTGSSSRAAIPDGIYVIRYSVAPNDRTYVEYNHLRITGIMKSYYKKLCDMDITPCEPKSKQKDLYRELNFIRLMIDAAKAKVEYCQSPNEGMQLYDYAKKKLEKITCSNECC
jgi:hypothetical protein